MRYSTRIWRIIAVVTGLLLLMMVIYFAQPQGSQAGKLKLVAAENFWGNIASQIGGERIEVTSIVSDPTTDPHLFETGARDIVAITNADIVVLNGRGYDDFIKNALATSPKANRVVIVAADTLKPNGDNPHIWYDVPGVAVVASRIEQELSKKDPAGSAVYKANLAAFVDSMQPLLDRLSAIKARYPDAPVAYTERVPGYLIERAGFVVKSPDSFATAIEEGNEPSPSDQASLLALIEQKQIRILFYNAQAESPVTQAIRQAAVANTIPVVAITETMPPGYINYQAWQLAQLDAVWQALENSK